MHKLLLLLHIFIDMETAYGLSFEVSKSIVVALLVCEGLRKLLTSRTIYCTTDGACFRAIICTRKSITQVYVPVVRPGW